MHTLTAFFFDVRMRLGPTLPIDPDIITINYIEDSSLENKPFTSLNADSFSKVLSMIMEQTPRVVILAFNPVYFLENNQDIEAIHETLIKYNNIFTNYIHEDHTSEYRVNNDPHLKLLKPANIVGWDLTSGAQDRVARRWILASNSGTDLFNTPNRELISILIDFNNISYKWERSGGTALHSYFRPPNSYPVIKGYELLKPNFNLQNFKDKVVVIGIDQDMQTTNFRKTPISYDMTKFPLREVLANAADSIKNLNYPKDLFSQHQKTFTFVILLLYVLILVSTKPIHTISISVSYILVYLLLAQAVYFYDLYLLEVSHTLVGLGVIQYLLVPYIVMTYLIERQKIINQQSIEKQALLSRARLTARTAKADLGFKIALQVAHDIRSPLAAISTVESMVRDRIDPDQSELLKLSVERVNSVAQVLLKKFKSGSLLNSNESLVEVVDMVTKLISSYKNTWPKVSFIFDTTTDSELIKLDRTELERALSNIINNSIEAMQNMGTITVSIHKDHEFLNFTIQDTGKGIPEDIIPKLFQQGFTHGKSSGTGIGLHQAKETFKKLGGDLILVTTGEAGTTFEAKIRISREQTIKIDLHKNVILVEDTDSDIQIWQLQFKNTKINPLVYKNPNQFLTDYRKSNGNFFHNEKWSLITDLIFEGHDETGFEILESCTTASDFFENTPPLLVTTLGDNEEIMSQARLYGAKVITKSKLNDLAIKVLS